MKNESAGGEQSFYSKYFTETVNVIVNGVETLSSKAYITVAGVFSGPYFSVF